MLLALKAVRDKPAQNTGGGGQIASESEECAVLAQLLFLLFFHVLQLVAGSAPVVLAALCVPGVLVLGLHPAWVSLDLAAVVEEGCECTGFGVSLVHVVPAGHAEVDHHHFVVACPLVLLEQILRPGDLPS